MRRSRYKEDQIVGMLKERRAGLWRRNCDANGISDATFYKWRSKYEENRLKKLLAESMLDISRDAEKKCLTPGSRRMAVNWTIKDTSS